MNRTILIVITITLATIVALSAYFIIKSTLPLRLTKLTKLSDKRIMGDYLTRSRFTSVPLFYDNEKVILCTNYYANEIDQTYPLPGKLLDYYKSLTLSRQYSDPLIRGEEIVVILRKMRVNNKLTMFKIISDSNNNGTSFSHRLELLVDIDTSANSIIGDHEVDRENIIYLLQDAELKHLMGYTIKGEIAINVDFGKPMRLSLLGNDQLFGYDGRKLLIYTVTNNNILKTSMLDLGQNGSPYEAKFFTSRHDSRTSLADFITFYDGRTVYVYEYEHENKIVLKKDIIGPLDGINSNFVKTKQGIYFINYYDEDGKKKYIFQKIIDGEYELLQFGVAPNIGDIVIGYWKLNKYYITITYGLYSSNDELYKVEFEPINNKVEQVEYFPRYFYTNDSIWYQGGRRSYYQL